MLSKRIDRRTLLRGAGTVAIGLPFLEEMMRPGVAFGQSAVPTRLITTFFGLGLDPDWQRDFSGPLQPYQPFENKMAFFSVNADQGTIGGAHCNTATVVFVGERAQDRNIAGGASIDQIVRNAQDPTAPTLVSGLWWRRGACDAQAQRVYNADGTPRPPVKRPSEVFDRIFGSFVPPTPGPDPEAEAVRRANRLKRSILDKVLDQYRDLVGQRSSLGVASKRKIDQHLSSIREIETRLAPADEVIDPDPGTQTCSVSDRPTDPAIDADYDQFSYGTGAGAPTVSWQDTQTIFHLHADLYALALRCDVVRYGNLMFESAGGHTNFSGTYRALGESTDFPGTSQHDSYFHGNQRPRARLYQHFAQTNIAYFLQQLDSTDHLEANGKTVLDNTTVVIGTEYGWNHSKENLFHAVVGGAGRFRSGWFTDRTMNCIDLYNAILTGHGLPANVGQRTEVESEGDASVLLA